MILIIDNYDSFTYNLVHLVAQSIARNTAQPVSQDVEQKSARIDSQATDALKAGLAIYRNDQITVEEISSLQPDGILISPGPGRPGDAGVRGGCR